MSVVVKAVDVTVTFGSVEALKRVSLEVKKNEKLCIIGPSGSGKTTFIRCLNQLQSVSEGRIYINDERIGCEEKGAVTRPLSAKAIARQRSEIGMVFQRFNLFPHLTAVQNIIEGPVHVKKVEKDIAIVEALGLLERVGSKTRRMFVRINFQEGNSSEWQSPERSQ